MRRICAIFIVVIMGSITTPNICLAQPQYLPFRRLTQYEDLLQQDNNYIYTDTKGYTWISSVSGLNRFNGVDVKTYTPNEADPCAIKGHNITSPFFEDKDANIWFSTYEGLHCWNRKKDCFIFYPLKDATGKILGADNLLFARDEQGRFWILNGFNRIYTYTPGAKNPQHRIMTLNTPKCFPGYENEQLKYIFAYNSDKERLCAFNIKKGTIDTTAAIYPDLQPLNSKGLRINTVWHEGDHKTWVGTDHGLLKINLINPGKNELFPLPLFEGKHAGVSAIFPYSDTQLLVGSYSAGVYIFNKNKKFTHHYKAQGQGNQGLSGNDIRNVYADKNGNIWVALMRGEVDYVNVSKIKFETIFTSSDLELGDKKSGLHINKLLQTPDGKIWIGTQKEGLFVVNKKKQVKPYCLTRDSTDQEEIFSLFPDAKGNVWACRGPGILSFFEAGKPPVNLNMLLNPKMDVVLAGLVAANGDLFLCNYTGGLFVLPKNQMHRPLEKIDTFSAANTYTYLFQAADQRLYACRNWEQIDIFIHKNPNWQLDRSLNIKGFVNDMIQSRKSDTIYIATSFGLVCLNAQNGQFRTLTNAQGLPDQNIQAILEDDHGRLWFSTKRGIVQYEPTNGRIRNYHLSDGLQSMEFLPAACRLQDGSFLFGGTFGVNRFFPDSIRHIDFQPPIELSSIQINDTLWRRPICEFIGECNVNEVRKIKLKYKQRTIAISFVGMDCSDPQQVSYQYYMENYDPKGDTTYSGHNGFAKYTKLPPGQYVLHIFATNADKAAKSHRALHVEILPPFWQTWWFITLAVMAVLYVVWRVFRFFANKKLRKLQIEQEKLAELQKERDRIASEMHDDLGVGLSTIRLMSERIRNSIKDAVGLEQIDRIAYNASELIEKMATIIWAMNSTHDTVEGLFSYLRRYAFEYLETYNIICRFPVPDFLPEVAITGPVRRHIFLTYKEALHNVVKHAKATEVNIHLSVENNKLFITISDNGIGLPPEKKYGNGLVNMKKKNGSSRRSLRI